MILAVTGGTGFVGRHFLRIAVEAGHEVRALARSTQAPQSGVTWIPGTLAEPADLCAGADAVVHIAGVINARTRAEFDAGNVAGTASMLSAARAANVRRFVHVSSLAAREPQLSSYGASKLASEALVESSDLDWSIIRPPGVYGPGDRETLALFQLAARGFALTPWAGRVSMIEVSDLCRALLALAAAPPTFAIHEVDDGTPVDHATLSRIIGEAVGRRLRMIRVPAAGMAFAAAIDTAQSRLRGHLPRLSFERARYLAHPDWVVRGDNLAGLWAPQVDLASGTAAAAAWYRAQGWL
ncbi:NAD-dependent epimerase/dehydratase family protein [Glacieibacterium sp.]|uniref:NAD-dependent epimerase/dehydratase family protein n=1 Tax=Glacieibacterium sp. TaxID=2860237 RepID=UPI003B00142D